MVGTSPPPPPPPSLPPTGPLSEHALRATLDGWQWPLALLAEHLRFQKPGALPPEYLLTVMMRSLDLNDLYRLGRYVHAHGGWPLATAEQTGWWDWAMEAQVGLSPATVLAYVLSAMAGCGPKLATLHLEDQRSKLADWVAAFMTLVMPELAAQEYDQVRIEQVAHPERQYPAVQWKRRRCLNTWCRFATHDDPMVSALFCCRVCSHRFMSGEHAEEHGDECGRETPGHSMEGSTDGSDDGT